MTGLGGNAGQREQEEVDAFQKSVGQITLC